MKKLTDVFPEGLTGNGIFLALAAYDVPWKEEVSSIALDLEYYGNISGDKPISPLVNKLLVMGVLSQDSVNRIAESLYLMHSRRWSKMWDTYLLEYDPIQNYSMTERMSDDETVRDYGRIHSKTGTESDDRDRTDNTTDAIYGFNSANPSNSNKSDADITDDNVHTYNVTDSDTGSDTETRNYELTREGNIGVTTSQQMIESERKLWRWSFFYDVVFPDVDRFLTIPVYTLDCDDSVSNDAPTGTIEIVNNGSYDVTTYAEASVNVPNTYGAADEGKVVSNGELTSQTELSIILNGSYDTTLINEVDVNVPNTYTAADEGKVVVEGSLVGQTALNIIENGVYDTTTKNEVTVNIPASIFEVVDKYVSDMKRGYVNTGDFTYELSGTTRCDVWRVTANDKYMLMLGSVVSNRFRAMFTDVDVSTVTSNVDGVLIGADVDNPAPYTAKGVRPSTYYANIEPFTAPSDGYIVVGKTSLDVLDIPCYLIKLT